MSEYLDRMAIELQLDGATWTDITRDVLFDKPVNVRYGIAGSGPLDRVAATGTLTFTLRDDRYNAMGREGAYLPGSPYRLDGFVRGCRARLRLTYQGETYTKFYGRLAGIEPDRRARTVKVTATDWMDLAGSHELRLVSYTSNKRIDEIVPLIVANMPIAPLELQLATGQDTYPDVFDTVRDKTRAASEFGKLAFSEVGYIYLKYGLGHDEILAVEGRYTRAEKTAARALPIPTSLSGRLLDENGETLLTEDSGRLVANGETFPARLNQYVYGTSYDVAYLLQEANDNLLFEDGDTCQLDAIGIQAVDNAVINFEIVHGDLVYNQVRYTAYPRLVDAAPTTVLFSLNSPIQIAPGDTKANIFGRFRDPAGGASRVAGRDLQTPAATTDYLMNSTSDGSGTNLTANLTVTAQYGVEGVSYTLTNTSASVGYVTKLQARGRGVYTYDTITLMVEDAASQLIHGARALNLDLKYQKSIANVESFAQVFLDLYRAATTDIRAVQFNANRSAAMMTLFLAMEPGDRFGLSEQVSGIDQDYFIQGVEFDILNKVVMTNWTIKSASYEPSTSYWRLETVGQGELNLNTILGY
jgi:hypothetical protein